MTLLSRSSLLPLTLLLLTLLAATICVFASKEDVQAEAERKRAAMPPEELAKMVAENTLDDADLLPTTPPAKQWKPTGKPEFALLLTPGLSKGCQLKVLPNLKSFLRNEAKYYPELIVDYAIGGDPKLKFYATKEQRDAGLIHGEFMSEEDILSLLQNGPNVEKEPILSIELKDDPEIGELKYILSQHRLFRAEDPNEDHSSQRIFKRDFVPVE